MKNKNVLYYIFGVISGLVIIPVIQEFNNVIMAWIQALLIKPSKIVLQGNKELSEFQTDEEYCQTNCIGFQTDDLEEFYDDDEE